MDKRPRILRVVVASPGDVPAERALVVRIADDLNKVVAADRGLRLEVARWETDAFPAMDPGGAQPVVDRALDIPNADLLVGIFWKRFGTPTADAASGTEHEIRLACEARERRGRPEVMLYFNQRAYKPE